MDEKLVASILPLLGAVIGAAVALIGAWLSKSNTEKQLHVNAELKVADYRQAWINSLRDAMAEFQSYGVNPATAHENEREFYAKGTKIELLMNPSDHDYEELRRCMSNFLSAEGKIQKYSCNQPYIDVCQRILKREWEKVKFDVRNAKDGH